MEYTYLGRTGMKISRVALGTMNFGPTTDEKEACRIMDAALEAGINFFDTANMYGFRPDTGFNRKGLTEEIIGRWFALGGGRREKTVLATKIFNAMNDPNDGPNDVMGYSTYKIRRHLDACLRRLQTDRVEILYLHGYDPNCTWTEAWEALYREFYRGKFDYVGSSNFTAENISDAQATADRKQILGLVTEEHRYSLLAREAEKDVLPLCKEKGIGVIVHSPLSGGMLSGSIFGTIAQGGRSQKFSGRLSDAERARLTKYHELCGQLGESESNVALAWVLRNPAVSAVLSGPRTVEQLQSSLRAAELKLPDDFCGELGKIFPRP